MPTPSSFQTRFEGIQYYKTWMEKQLSLYVAWDHFARNINLHVSLIHIGNPLNDFNHTYMPHLDSHPDDPLFWKHCSKGWATYIMWESYLGRKLLAGAILGSPTSLAEVQRLVQMKGKTKKGYHSSPASSARSCLPAEPLASTRCMGE